VALGLIPGTKKKKKKRRRRKKKKKRIQGYFLASELKFKEL
jgi:hypothetical protein